MDREGLEECVSDALVAVGCDHWDDLDSGGTDRAAWNCRGAIARVDGGSGHASGGGTGYVDREQGDYRSGVQCGVVVRLAMP